ncbi:hypothetical protein [Paenibacillus haidiansis]|uniref:hypothetical protein n=1 Tax=Paenibacillus haidiansis TaxID=1574488 RepID=UPI002F9326E6
MGNGRYIALLNDGNVISGQENETSGYIVPIPAPKALYSPRFNLPAWQTYQAATTAAEKVYQVAYTAWASLPEGERGEPPVYAAPEQPELWGEGLTPEEIEALTAPQPQEPTELDRIGAELVTRELEALEIKQQNEALGAQVVGLELRVLGLESVNEGSE